MFAAQSGSEQVIDNNHDSPPRPG